MVARTATAEAAESVRFWTDSMARALPCATVMGSVRLAMYSVQAELQRVVLAGVSVQRPLGRKFLTGSC